MVNPPHNKNKPLLVILVGPTGSGKSALALHLAEHLQGEVVSCDSVAVYRGMDLGSAKPSPADRARIPHHLLDVTTPSIDYSAGDYSRAARAAIASIAARHKKPIIDGGTGLYLRALLDGLSTLPPRNESLRTRLAQAPPAALHRALRRLDPAAATRIHLNDASKLIRAIEIAHLTAQPTAQAWQQQQPEPLTGYRILQFALSPPRADLYRRIDTRCKAMFAAGLVEETHTLLAQYGPTRPLNALGYRQAQQVLAGELTEPEAIAQTQQAHRNYAKRQLTWFRKDPRLHWLETFGEQAMETVLRSCQTNAE